MGSTPEGLAALHAHSIGLLADGTLRPSESLDVVWQHIGDSLMALADSAGPEELKLSEEPLTQRLVDELEQRPGYRPYYFHKEYGEEALSGHRRRGDIAVLTRDDGRFVVNGVRYAGRKRFLQLEAKRLPTPRADREREYLTGDGGAVERFKAGHHAPDLRTVGIIGYIQLQSFDHWRVTINGWVDELVASSAAGSMWDEQDRLILEGMSAQLAWLRSSNLRVTDKQRLNIRHIWVQLARTTTPRTDRSETR
jgi:hypothetical protein